MNAQISQLPILDRIAFYKNVSNPMIQSHYHQSNGPWLHMIKHWICASEVLLTETKSKAVENGATDAEGE